MKVKIVYSKPIRYYIDGVEITEQEYNERVPTRFTGGVPMAMMETSKAWPILSESLGVHPKQVDEAQEHAKKIGVPTEFCRKTGRAIIRNNAHLRDFNKAHGYRNQDGGYGQITG